MRIYLKFRPINDLCIKYYKKVDYLKHFHPNQQPGIFFESYNHLLGTRFNQFNLDFALRRGRGRRSM